MKGVNIEIVKKIISILVKHEFDKISEFTIRFPKPKAAIVQNTESLLLI